MSLDQNDDVLGVGILRRAFPSVPTARHSLASPAPPSSPELISHSPRPPDSPHSPPAHPLSYSGLARTHGSVAPGRSLRCTGGTRLRWVGPPVRSKTCHRYDAGPSWPDRIRRTYISNQTVPRLRRLSRALLPPATPVRTRRRPSSPSPTCLQPDRSVLWSVRYVGSRWARSERPRSASPVVSPSPLSVKWPLTVCLR